MPRRYDNSGRRAQALRTRRRIVDAAITCLGRPGGRLNMADVGRKANVALPTVYKHFRTRDRLLAAVKLRVDETDARPPVPDSPSALRGEVPALHAFFRARAGIVRAITYQADLSALREAAFRARDANMQRALAVDTAHLSPDEERALRALLVRVIAAPAWLELKDRHRLPDDVITRMTEWAVHALLDRLADDARRARRRRRRARTSGV